VGGEVGALAGADHVLRGTARRERLLLEPVLLVRGVVS
jgi:hypothetical protein